ncbi:nodulation protein NfeD related protein [Thermoplasma acidophilum]|uniref:Nodulation protein NfeD related protein n=2 Tax=Thermoplasma acidophilum TaxID=2303 RepID=Q9HJ87_THEAC|nr:nodulation protein NfeD related protein [Thermoplasma acidophilum]
MHRPFIIAVMAVFLLLLLVSIAADSQAQPQKNVVVIYLDEEIDAGSAAMITSTMNSISNTTTAAVVIDMNTPGGELENMIQMVSSITSAESRGIITITYVPQNAMAASAGSYVAMATDYIFMANGTYIGPSTPIVVGGTSLEQQHTTSAMEQYMVSLAAEHGRNTTAAYSMVSNNTAYNDTEAYRIHLINGIYGSLDKALASLSLSSYPQVSVYPSAYDNFLSFLSNAYVDGIFILLGFVAIMLDIYHGSVVLTIAGITLLILGFLGLQLISASLVGVLLLLMGSVLIILEAKMGHGFALLSGVVVGLIGTFLLASPYYSSNPGYSPSPFTTFDLLTSILIVIVAGFLAFYIRRIVRTFKFRGKWTGAESLIGKMGYAVEGIDEKGWVSVDGIEWQARSSNGSRIPKGSRVKIVGRDGLILIVEKQEDEQLRIK